MTRTLKAVSLLVAIAVAAGAGCTVKKQEAPDIAGPSELGTALALYASPDTLRQDGSSQSTITVQALNSQGAAVKQPMDIRLDVAVDGTVVDFGQLSSKNLRTGSDGKATATYTAPRAPADSVDTQTVVQILATPVGTDYASALARSVSIRLVPPGVIQAPNGAPTASFTFSPSAPVTKSDVTFDASLSKDADGSIVAYAWNFGDGSQGSGVLVRHSYSSAGTYTATLTVTDDRGLPASTSQSVTVSMTSKPTASFVYSPGSPAPNDKVYFNAAASTAAVGRTIVRYDWDYGTGRQDSGLLVWQIFTLPGEYVVQLTVTDDAGETGTASKTVSVTAAASKLSPAFSFSPTKPTNGNLVYFNASGSTALNPISSYAWNFGDGGTASGATPNHIFACTGGGALAPDVTFVVQLTIKDSTGATATASNNVTVTKCGT
jgi:PKD repeat protein